MIAAIDSCRSRVGLDALVAGMQDPGFAIRFRRVPMMRERPGHVSPSMLAMQPRRSNRHPVVSLETPSRPAICSQLLQLK